MPPPAPTVGAAPAAIDPSAPQQAVLFFDADCGLCARSVRWLLRLDRQERLRFAPIGGATWRALLDEDARRLAPDSALLLTGGRLLSRSAAILGALRATGATGALLAAFARIVPPALAERLYDAVARRRRRDAACRLLPADCGRRLLP